MLVCTVNQLVHLRGQEGRIKTDPDPVIDNGEEEETNLVAKN